MLIEMFKTAEHNYSSDFYQFVNFCDSVAISEVDVMEGFIYTNKHSERHIWSMVIHYSGAAIVNITYKHMYDSLSLLYGTLQITIQSDGKLVYHNPYRIEEYEWVRTLLFDKIEPISGALSSFIHDSLNFYSVGLS